MPIQKPAPLMIDGRAHYTLSSVEPIKIEVTVPFVTDEGDRLRGSKHRATGRRHRR